MNYIENSIQNYIKDLSSEKSSPGGGSVVALNSLQSVSLLTMVSKISLKKLNQKKSPQNYQKEINNLKKVVKEATAIKTKLEKQIDEDVIVFKKILSSYKDLSKHKKENKTPNQKLNKELKLKLKKAILTSINLSYSMFQSIEKTIKLTKEIVDISYKELISDLAIVANSSLNNMENACFNVRINIKSLLNLESNYQTENKNENLNNSLEKKLEEKMSKSYKKASKEKEIILKQINPLLKIGFTK